MVDVGEIKREVDQTFQRYSVSKRRIVQRLVFEIVKREKTDIQSVLRDATQGRDQFSDVKGYLIFRRYPNLSKSTPEDKLSFSELSIDSNQQVDLSQKRDVLPKHFFIEEEVLNTPFVGRLHVKFPEAVFETISTYKQYCKEHKYTVDAYNRRLESYFIVKENYDFYKRCACSHQSVYCGYHVVNLGSGCAFECSYCYLQDYINSPGIVLPANVEDFLNQFKNYKENIRLGSGELTDSLIFDHITEYSIAIVNFFREQEGSTFEFKTKSVNIGNLLKVKATENVVVSWSMNPPEIIETIEHYTATLQERIEAAVQCVEHGYRVAFHFDPMIHYPGWKKGYTALADAIFDRIPEEKIAWLSLGTLRMTPRLKKIIENRFFDNTILDEEFMRGHDGKLRYGFDVRTRMYTHLKGAIRSHAKDVYIYLCMEEKDACLSSQTAPLKQFT